MPTQRSATVAATGRNSASPRLSRCTPVSSTALMTKYSPAKAIIAAATPAALATPAPSSRASAHCSSEPEVQIDRPVMAGVTSRLVQRLDVRKAPSPVSPAATRAAAAGPIISSTRKMKASPTAKDCLAPGTRTGNRPEPTARARPTVICSATDQGCCSTHIAQPASTLPPRPTISHQKAVALGV